MEYSLISPKLLTKYGVCGEVINILEDFRSDRKQRVVLNGQCSSSTDIHAGVPQGFTLGPLLLKVNIILVIIVLKVNANCLLMTHDIHVFVTLILPQRILITI